jgi:hypothetical protein
VRSRASTADPQYGKDQDWQTNVLNDGVAGSFTVTCAAGDVPIYVLDRFSGLAVSAGKDVRDGAIVPYG